MFSKIYIFPGFDPVFLQIGPFAIHYYALAYIGGLGLAIYNAQYFTHYMQKPFHKKQLWDAFNWLLVGTILGGRFGYVIFYNFSYYIRHPIEIFYIWQGGMSFHGGMIGVILGSFLYCRRTKLNFLSFSDMIGMVIPIGLLFGRLTNFINGELWGRPTNGEWGVVFPNAGSAPRHPSQLYEAFLEGIVLYLVLFLIGKYTKILHRPGMMAINFIIGYSMMRFIVEFFREPDAHLGLFYLDLSRGQYLSLLQFLFGVSAFIIFTLHYRKK